MTDWILLNDDMTTVPYPFYNPEYVGFTYQIFGPFGKIYIGKKVFVNQVKKPPLKGAKRARKSIVESDWKDYYGSNEELHADINLYGKDKFTRVILRLCKTKTEMSYYELKAQMQFDVLLYPNNFYNGYVGTRINRRATNW